MSKYIFITAAMMVFSIVSAAQNLVRPGVSHPAAFAIIIDQASFENANDAVLAYKNMLEDDGLSVYILHGNWTDPMHVRDHIIRLYRQDPSLEGVVFIGDIPVPMIRQAQHMTTAFKMNESTFPRQRSSVASDRFYDDFDLEFTYIGQDEEHHLWHYYNLTPDSPQVIRSNIYSGRIMPLKNGTDAHQQITDYLEKVVAERRQPNQLDHLFSFFGSHYNSQCLIAWASEKIALHQQFPHLSKIGHSLKYMAFHMSDEIKSHLMNELQREELDVALLHKHGSVDIQHLSNALPPGSTREMVQSLKNSIFQLQQMDISDEDRLRRANWFGIPVEWLEQTTFADDFTPTGKPREAYELRVHEVLAMNQGARFIMFDACYNGSFHHAENIAGAYLFNAGNTIATIGNTVNVLQDNWPNRYIGLLSEGVRLGHLRQHIHTLENHIVGDPTFRFFPLTGDIDLNRFIAENKHDAAAWQVFLQSDNPDLVGFALQMISRGDPPGFSDLLFDLFMHSGEYTVRMECLHLLRDINDHNYHAALRVAVTDSYELVRRLAGAWMEDVGLPEFIPFLVHMAIYDPEYLRVSGYVAPKALGIYPSEMVLPEIDRQFALAPNFAGEEEMRSQLNTMLETYWRRADANHHTIFYDTGADEESRFNAIRILRNNNFYHHLDDYLAFAEDKLVADTLRVMMIEALGWFTHAYNKQQIIDRCAKITADGDNAEMVRLEAGKTVRRLREVTRH